MTKAGERKLSATRPASCRFYATVLCENEAAHADATKWGPDLASIIEV
jgi:hypothetical protein